MVKFFHFCKSCVESKKFDSFLVASLLLIFAVFVAIGIHGFSIGCFDVQKSISTTIDSYYYPHILKSRQIRSDEWAVSTPQVFSQCLSKEFFPRINHNFDNGTDMFLSTPCNPVWDWTVIGQFHNWGYFIFDIKRGLAWNWWCRYLGIPLFAYFFFLWWLGKDRTLALTAALAVTLGTPTQWWDTTIPYMLLYFFASIYGIRLIYLSNGKILKESLGTLILTISFVSFLFVGYPIFELLLLPPLLILLIHAAIESKKEVKNTNSSFRCNLWIFFVFCIVLFEIGYYFTVHASALKIISASSYPGARIFQGGSLISMFQNAKFDILSLFSELPKFNLSPELQKQYVNPCGASRCRSRRHHFRSP